MKVFTAVVMGGLAGFGLHKLVGCRTGTCPITKNPWISILYGVLLGLLIVVW